MAEEFNINDEVDIIAEAFSNADESAEEDSDNDPLLLAIEEML